MDRIACISLPALALQIGLRTYANASQLPIALVRDDRPASPILQLNSVAKALGLRPGLRYSEALSIVADLRAVVVSAEAIDQVRQTVLTILARFSPVIEANPFDQGSFWLNARGLSGLFGSEPAWGSGLRQAVAETGFRATVVVGFSRLGTYLLTKAQTQSKIVTQPVSEQQAIDRAPLRLLPFSTRNRRLLRQLNIQTLGALLQIPSPELAARFGADLVTDLRQILHLDSLPLQATPEPENLSRYFRLEYPISDQDRLMAIFEEPLTASLNHLARWGKQLAELRLVLTLESGEIRPEVLRPAEPTTDYRSIYRLLALRLEQQKFPTGVTTAALQFFAVKEAPTSGELFAPTVARDLKKGAEAVALIRAKWGNAAAVRAALVDTHQPEAAFRWETVEQLRPPRPALPTTSTAIRRVATESSPEPGVTAGQRLGGSYRLHAVAETEIDREYVFLLTSQREVHWVSWDHQAHRSRWQGVVD